MQQRVSRKNGVGVDKILKTISPLTKLESGCGLFRCRFVDGQFKPITAPFKIYRFIIIFLIVLSNTFLFIHENRQSRLDTELLIFFAENISFLVMITYNVMLTIIFLKFSEKNIRLIKVLAKIEDKLHISNNIEFYKISRRHLILSIFIYFLMYFSCYVPNVIMDEKFSMIRVLVEILSDCERRIESFVLYSFVKMLLDRLDILNKYLATFVNLKKRSHSFSCRYNKNVDITSVNYIGLVSNTNNKISHLASAYKDIGEVKNLLNEIFNFQIFMSLLSSFIYLIIMIWSSIYYFRKCESFELIDIAVQCIVEVIMIFFLFNICEVMNCKRNITNILVNEIVMDYELPKTMRQQAKAFVELIEVWPMKISAYDMYLIDIKLLLKFMSVSTTYIIVIIQLSHFL